MADFECPQLEIGLEFVHRSSAERNIFEPTKDAQVIRVRGRQPHEFLNSNYLFYLKPCERPGKRPDNNLSL